MQITNGRICKTGRICGLLHNSADEVNGFVLDNGVGVRFAPNHTGRVLALTAVNSRVGVTGRICESSAHDTYIDADYIGNLDSMEMINLYGSSPPPSPEVSAVCSSPPSTAVPLAPASKDHSESLVFEHPELHSLATRRDVVDDIDQAYERLHLTQAMLAYLKMIGQDQTMVGQYLDEAKHTYVQALSSYQSQDFEGARQFASASISLSRLVEILVSRTFHSNASYPKLVPPPPEHSSSPDDKEAARHCLDDVERLLARVQLVTANGTLPSRERAQVEKFSSWCERLCRLARRLLETDSIEDAMEFAHAAQAAVCSAEHLCRKCYFTQRADRHQAPAPRRSA